MSAFAVRSRLRVEGVSLEYQRLPPARADDPRTLVLMHEGLGCVDLWRRFPERLAQATGLGVFLWSRAGYGSSDPTPLPRPLDYHAREGALVSAILTAADVHRPILVGHSDGGTIALLHAAGGKAPLSDAVVTVAAHVFVEDVSIAGIREAKQAFEAGDLRARLARWHGENVDCAFRGWCDAWLDPDFRDWNIERDLATIRAPVLAMQGVDDHYGTSAQVEAIVAGVSGPAEPLMLTDAGHSPHLEQPEALIAAISRYVASLPANGL
ncbi:MAG: alpha/beta hydrolase [Rhodospirillales bacterium]|nr:alpha/beta hydrolase [Rhodospirillales bacterium]